MKITSEASNDNNENDLTSKLDLTKHEHYKINDLCSCFMERDGPSSTFNKYFK